MNIASLAIASIKSQPLPSALSILATAAGMALLSAVLLFGSALESGFRKNAQNIDIVAGVKGSPLQMILSSVYHIDVPAGNMTAADVKKISENRNIKKSIPIAMGDSYRGFRIIGSTKDYFGLYNAEISEGTVFNKPFEAVAGSLTGLTLGSQFAAMHGLSENSSDHHDESYHITGILKPTGTVLDRLIITPIKSVQESHDHHHEEDEEGITALLIQVRSPTAIMNLPRDINQSTNIMAASPSYVMARFSQDLGLGKNSLALVGSAFLALSILIIITILCAKLESRKYDLAVLHVLGASPLKMAGTVMMEGCILALAGTIIGLLAGHALGYAALEIFGGLKNIIDPALFLIPSSADILLLTCGLFCGIIGGIVPTLMALRTDVTVLLSRGRT